MGTFANYQREERVRIEPGNHRVVIVDAEETTAKSSGNPMIVITVRPSGSDVDIKYYLVENEWFNKNATSFFDSFDIEEGDFTLIGWIGAMGAAKIRENEDGFLEVHYFIDKKKATTLPPWTGEKPERQTITEFQTVTAADDLPFD